MSEQPFFFPGPASELFGVFHAPSGQAVREPFVFCHPFAEEKLWTHRTFVLFARRLARQGHPVLRFDHMGHGDSAGTFGDATVDSMLADIKAAIGRVGQLTGDTSVSLLGLRLGATMAGLAAEQIPSVRRLVLWAPIVDGGRYMQDLLRMNVTTQAAVYSEVRHDREALVEMMRAGETVNMDGYDLSHGLYSSVSGINLQAEPKTCDGPCLIVQVDRGPRPSPELDALASRYTHATRLFAQEEPFWKEIARSYQREAANLFTVTLDWIDAA